MQLVLITDRKICKLPLVDMVKLAINGGVDTVQLREKDLPYNEFFKLALELRGITNELEVRLIINDRAKIALAVNADGLHIGKNSIPINMARKIVGANKLIGYSAHNFEEAKHAQNGGANYISYSPIFLSQSKANSIEQKPVGAEALKDVRRILNIPVIALGGINEYNVAQVMENGADGIAVMSNILQSDDPFLAVGKLKDKLIKQKHK